ncbi:MAG: HAD family phosphatase [Rhodospirillales bacterium]|nr:HAD family phosphatase [Rhodospirillales bacterium]
MGMHSLIIFDCDGTLVDSEMLYNTVTAELLNEIGYDEYTPQLCLERFSGKSWSTMRDELEEHHGEPMPADIIQRYIKIAGSRMDTELKPASNADSVLENLKSRMQICIGSNGERGNVIKSLTVTGLMPHFDDDRIFTKIQVENPKPAPDLFLFACDRMQTRPANALVIEDSPSGVAAAKAAGIDVLGYIGTAHDKTAQAQALQNAGANTIIDELIHIERHLKA